MDRTSDIMSAEAQVLHAALDERQEEVDRRLAGFTDRELASLYNACTRVRLRIKADAKRRLAEAYPLTEGDRPRRLLLPKEE